MRWLRSKGNREATTPRRRDVRRAAGLAMLVAVGLVVWTLLEDDSATSTTQAEIVSVEGLREKAEERDTPIYWAGALAGTELELSQPASDRTYVRYLTGAAEAGDPRPFLTVSSYLVDDPVAALRGQGAEADGVLARSPGGGTVFFSRSQPESVYLAYPDSDVQIEVFAPEFKEALELVTSGKVVPVE